MKKFGLLCASILGITALVGCNNGSSEVTITFDSNGGTFIPANDDPSNVLKVKKGTTWKDVAKKPTAKKDNYTFSCWTKVKDDYSSGVSDTFTFDNDITLYAYYDAIKYEYKFVVDGVEVKQMTINAGEVIEAPIEDPDDKHAKGDDGKYYHYTFDGWFDEDNKEFVEGTKITKNVTYTAKFDKGLEIINVPGEEPTCSSAGFEEAWKCEDCGENNSNEIVNYIYYSSPDNIKDCIGDEEDYQRWISIGGGGYIDPVDHDYEVVVGGDYKKVYTAYDTFESKNLEVKLHCKYEQETTHDITIDSKDITLVYQCSDNKLHVENGGVSVTFTYDNKPYSAKIPNLTINPKKFTKPAQDTTVFTYDGTEKTYNVEEQQYYTVTGNKQTEAGNHKVTISLVDKSKDSAWDDVDAEHQYDDLQYDFNIGKATPTISGLEDSYDTNCGVYPTVTGVSSDFGEVKIDVVDENHNHVDEDNVYFKGNYFVRAKVEASSNWDEAVEYAPLKVTGHTWGEEFAPTNYIGYKKHKCICGVQEETTNKMVDSDLDFINTYGGEVTGPETTTCSVSSYVAGDKRVIRYKLGEDGTVKINDSFILKLPKINYSLYDTAVRLTCSFDSWQKFGLKQDNLFSSTEDFQKMSIVVSGDESNGYSATLRVYNYNSTTVIFEDTLDNLDNNVVYGSEGLTLYSSNNVSGSNHRSINISKISLIDECTHDTYICNNYCIGHKVCEVCGVESETERMESKDIDLSLTAKYGAAISSDETGVECSVENAKYYNPNRYHIVYQAKCATEKKYNQLFELELPHVNYTLYNKAALFEFGDGGDLSWAKIGLKSDNCFSYGGDTDYVTVSVYKDTNDSYKACLVVYDKNDHTNALFVDSIDVTDTNILNGTDGLKLYFIPWDSSGGSARKFELFKISLLDSCEEHNIISNALNIGYKKMCSICCEIIPGEVVDDTDVKLNSLNSYSANADHMDSNKMAWLKKANVASQELIMPKVNYSLFSSFKFNFTSNSTTETWQKHGIGTTAETDNLISSNDWGKDASGYFEITKNADSDNYDLKISVSFDGSESPTVKTITNAITDIDVINGNKGLSLFAFFPNQADSQYYVIKDFGVSFTKIS